MKQQNIEMMREYERILMKDVCADLTSKEKKQKREFAIWFKTLDNKEACDIQQFLHKEKVNKIMNGS